MKSLLLVLLFLPLLRSAVLGEPASPLVSRGYRVLPAPQRVVLGPKDFEFTQRWCMEMGPEIRDDFSIDEFKQLLLERFHLVLCNSGAPMNGGGLIRLTVKPARDELST